MTSMSKNFERQGKKSAFFIRGGEARGYSPKATADPGKGGGQVISGEAAIRGAVPEGKRGMKRGIPHRQGKFTPS